MRVLVTGSSGFIGQHLLRACLERGWEAEGLDRNPPRGARARRCDLLDEGQDPLPEGCDAVLHAAARVQLHGRRGPVVAENVRATERLLEACERRGAPRFVFLSSASVLYERRDQFRLREDAALPAECLGAYAESKRACEALVRGYSGSWMILRPQSVIGPGDRTLIPPILRAARSGGWWWIRGMESVRVELLALDNLVAFCMAAVERPDWDGVVHLADGEPWSLEPLLGELFERLGIEVGRRRLPRLAAGLLAGALDRGMGLLAPEREPPLSRFGLEMLVRSRTLDTGRMRALAGPPAVSAREGFERMLADLQGAQRAAGEVSRV